MLPIAVMAIGGFFLGVGASIETNLTRTFGSFIKSLGDPVFAALPLLFAVSFVIAFTEEAGVAVFATIIAYLTFLAIQGSFISGTNNEGFTVLFGGGGRDKSALKSLVSSVLGIQTLQSSVFGGLLVGLVMAKLYNRFHDIHLPALLAFFGGKRFVALVGIVSMVPLAFTFLIFWPWIGIGLNKFGEGIGKVPYGIESFIFGYIERSLIPFGLHHAFYAPLWYSSAGGDLNVGLGTWFQTQGVNEWTKTYANAQQNGVQISNNNGVELMNSTKQFVANLISKGKVGTTDYGASKWQGDSTLAASIIGLDFNTFEWKKKNGNGNGSSLPLLQFLADELGIKLGRFTQGKYVFMQWGLPAAAGAMVFAAPKENRKTALSAVVPSAATAMVTGVTEPIEFTFLFLSPFLFWGFHAFMCALAFMLMNLFGAHIGQIFSGGLLDLFSYGILPVAKGTRFWIAPLIGLFYAPIYFAFFLFWIRYKNLATPGRGTTTKLFTKADWKQQVASTPVSPQTPSLTPIPKPVVKEATDNTQKAVKFVQAAGGFANLAKINNCASRLRFDVVDPKLVDEDALKAAGAFGVFWVGTNHCQIILGPISEQVAAAIRKAQATHQKG